jgi:signal transduction histidine kinase
MRLPLDNSAGWLTVRDHPLRFLLALEWLLLLFVALACFSNLSPGQAFFPRTIAPLPFLPPPFLRVFQLLILGMITLSGFWLPQKRGRWIYLGGLYGLILFLSYGGRLPLFQLLYVVFVARSCLLTRGRERWLLTGLVMVTVGVIQADRVQFWDLPLNRIALDRLILAVQVGTTILLGLILVFLQILVTALLAAQQSRSQLAQANEQLRRYALQIEDIAILQERNRIAREIHDALGHSLTAFNLHLEGAMRLLDADRASPDLSKFTKAKTLLQEAQALGKTVLQDVRRSVSILRIHAIPAQSLDDAIGLLCEDHERSTRIRPSYSNRLSAQRSPAQLSPQLSPAQTTALYRIVQESLTNIAKYAEAQSVAIVLDSIDNQGLLQISDDGLGFTPSQTQMGFGLQGMSERAIALGGHFDLKTAPDQGCTITLRFPLPHAHSPTHR